MKEFIVSYTKLKDIKTKRSLLYCYIEQEYLYTIFLVDNPKDSYYITKVLKDGNVDHIDFDTNIKSTTTLYTNLHDGIADQFIKFKPFTGLGLSRSVIEKTDTSKAYFCSHNFGDKCTWYQKALQISGELLSTTDNLTYISNHSFWIDEYRITSDIDLLKRIQIYIDGIPQITYASDGFRTIPTGVMVDFENGSVIFDTPTSGNITADYWYATTSEWEFMPSPGKRLRIGYIEGQASIDINPLTDIILFELYVNGFKFGGQKYKSIQDVNNWSNMPVVAPRMGELTREVVVYPWNYISETVLQSSPNMKIVVRLRNNIPLTWPNQTKNDFLTITFYCLSEDSN